MNKEIWKEIVGYEGLYAVSNLGNVKSIRPGGKQLKPNNSNGYLTVHLSRNSKVKSKRVHRLVAEAFIPNDSEERNQINHIDGNKKNNRLENLEWCTQSENIRHSFRVGLRSREELSKRMRGKKQSEETKKKRAEALSNYHRKKRESESPYSTSIVVKATVVNTGEEEIYPSMGEASRKLGVGTSSIVRAVDRENRTVCGRSWKRVMERTWK